jgi:hypothetical protein
MGKKSEETKKGEEAPRQGSLIFRSQPFQTPARQPTKRFFFPTSLSLLLCYFFIFH